MFRITDMDLGGGGGGASREKRKLEVLSIMHIIQALLVSVQSLPNLLLATGRGGCLCLPLPAQTEDAYARQLTQQSLIIVQKLFISAG